MYIVWTLKANFYTDPRIGDIFQIKAAYSINHVLFGSMPFLASNYLQMAEALAGFY